MKKMILEFVRRGMLACGLGPLVLVVCYLIIQHQENVQVLTVNQACLGIVSLSMLAFIAGGMNVLYQFERLPLAVAILIHGCILYISYLAVYLINGWLQSGAKPLIMFTVIFGFGYLLIWAVIDCVTKTKTKRINALLEKNRKEDRNL